MCHHLFLKPQMARVTVSSKQQHTSSGRSVGANGCIYLKICLCCQCLCLSFLEFIENEDGRRIFFWDTKLICIHFFFEGVNPPTRKRQRMFPLSFPLNAEPAEKAHFYSTTQKYLCSYCLSHVPAHDLRGGYSPKLAHLQ